MAGKRLIRLRGECPDGETCATVRFNPETDEFVMQGYVITDPQLLAELNLPECESAVRLPGSLFPELRKEVPAC
ncbi:MAG: hypothetical protein ACRDQW_09880 [Haloechinothrix sp.]